MPNGEVYGYAVKNILNRYGYNGSYLINETAKRPNGHANGNGAAAAPVANSKQEAEINFVLENSISIIGAQPETYLRKRGGVMPPAALGTDPDLLLNPSCVRRRAENKGHPTLVARLRYPDGRRSGGIHKTFLLPDGSHHLGDKKAKMMMGDALCKGTVVMLAPIDPANGTLGVGTGIETTLAAMKLYRIAGWAALSDGGLIEFAKHLRASNGYAVTGPGGELIRLQKLLVWADRGSDAEKDGSYLHRVARSLGIAVELYLPTGADDFADDLAKGLPPSLPQPEPAEEAPIVIGSEDAMAEAFSARHADEFRYVAAWGKWLRWDNTRWRFEDTLLVFDEARKIAREDFDKDTSKASIIAAIERLARADRRHAKTVDIWDADPWLLNTPGGIVDLRTGGMIAHDPEFYITKITAVAPDGHCSRWRQFLAEVTDNDEELQSYLQRVAGYNLTGITIEHALFFYYGIGGNGKSVYLNTLAAIMGNYSVVAPMETFIETHGERHPTDLAMLRGARLVTAQETEKGRRWAEGKIKALTGGDPITARFMRQDFFTYLPAFKLNIAGNNKPGLSSVDDAIKRRFNLLPFTVKIPNDKKDNDLPDKLREEWPGILQWAITGCLAWQREGLNPPKFVRDATEVYFHDEDALTRWVEDCCVIGDSNSWCASGRLWDCFKAWAEANNERVGSQKSFSNMLDGHGFVRGKEKEARGYRGIDLKAQQVPYNLNDAEPQKNG